VTCNSKKDGTAQSTADTRDTSDWTVFETRWDSDRVEWLENDGDKKTETNQDYIPTANLFVILQIADGSGYDFRTDEYDWVAVRNYVYPEPEVSSIKTEMKESLNKTLVAADASFSYDPVGNMISSLWNGTQTLLTYDARNRLIKEKLSVYEDGEVVDYETQYTYDGVGNVVSMVYPDQVTLKNTF
jgi:hypothetical protein